jgi:polysaccharide biosynthesis/export protein
MRRISNFIRGAARASFLCAACILLLAGCQSTPRYQELTLVAGPGSGPDPAPVGMVTITNRLDPQWLVPSTNLFTLGPGDRLEMELIGDTNSNAQVMVCPDGKIYFNMLDGVDVWGRTLSESKALVEQELGKYIRNGPKVAMALRRVESKRVWLLGRVQAPGVYPLNGPTTLLEALAGAGGTLSFLGQREIPLSTAVEELADLQRSFIIRRGKLLPIDFDRLMNHGDLRQNIYLEPDDFVYLPPAAAKEVFVIGAVAQPRSVAYTERLGLVGAIAEAYGPVKDAYLSQVAVVRGSLAQPQLTVVNYNDIVRGKARDIPLQPRDIVYVPFSPYRYLVRYAEIIINTFATSMAINAGSSLVLRQQSQGGIFIPVGSRVTVVPPLPPVQ